MSSSETNRPLYGPRLSVMDFFTFTESMQTCFSPDYPVPSLGQSDLNFVINAPLDYYPPACGALATLYFDQADCSRTLPENTYQVRCTHRLNTHEFMGWAEQGIEMIRVALMHRGLICIDITDLIRFLQACESHKLILEVIRYEESLDVPWDRLKNFRFKNLFSVLFAGHDLTLQMYSDLGNAIDEINPNAELLKLGANFHMHPLPVVMLLGELES